MNDTTTPEQVLVIPRPLFEDHESFTGFRSLAGRKDLGVYLQGAPVRHASFMPRDEAENDPFFKQLIPYVLILSEDKIFLYRRGEIGSEERLRGQYSIGIGGHINDEDHAEEPFYAFLAAVERELKEETGIQIMPDQIEGSVIGLVNDDSNDVGRVHLGVVLAIQISAASAEAMLKTCENTICEAQWIPLYELENPSLTSNLETWSRFVAEHLIKESSVNGKWDCPAFRERAGMLAIAASNLAASAAGLMLQDSPRRHMLGKQMVESSAGEVQCMIAGLIANDDIEGHKVKQAAKHFHDGLGSIVRHQAVTEKTILQPVPPPHE